MYCLNNFGLSTHSLVSPQVEEVYEDSFSVRCLQKSGKKYAYGNERDVDLIKEGPPDHYRWIVLTPFDYSLDKFNLYYY